MSPQKIVPELYCSDLAQSLSFYTGVCGFRVLYERPENRFAFITNDGAELMLEQPTDSERMLLAAVPEYPYGRGINLQIEVGDVDDLHERIVASGGRVTLPLEERWYRVGRNELGNRQFAVMDPDGYLLRFFSKLGARAAPSVAAEDDAA